MEVITISWWDFFVHWIGQHAKPVDVVHRARVDGCAVVSENNDGKLDLYWPFELGGG